MLNRANGWLRIFKKGCISLACSQNGQSIVCLPVGIRKEGITLTATKTMRLRVTNLLTGEEIQHIHIEINQQIRFSGNLRAVVLLGDMSGLDGEVKRDSNLN